MTRAHGKNRNRIRVKRGVEVYFQFRLKNKGKEGQLIADVQISNVTNWRNQHLNAIKFAYQKAPYYDTYFPFLKELYSRKWDSLQELDIYITNFVLQELGNKAEILYDRDFDFQGEKNELLINICHELGEKEYMSKQGKRKIM